MKNWTWCLALLAVQPACKLSTVSRDGPAPQPAAVTRADAGFPADAVVCVELGGTIEISGQGFSPMPARVLTDTPDIEQPAVTLVSSDGTRHVLGPVTYDPATGNLTAVIPDGKIEPGAYALEVQNPNGRIGTLADAMRVVPPPTLVSITPSSGPNSGVTPVAIDGTGFWEAADGTDPTVELTPSVGGSAALLAPVTVTSASRLDTDVPAGLALGFYDLSVTNPEGCSASLPMAFEVTLPPTIDLCAAVDPAFGWVDGRTRIEICADNGAGNGLRPVPEAVLLVDPDGDGMNITEVPLIREALLSTSTPAGGFADASVMSAVVPSSQEARGAGIEVGGPYDIRVVNPDGAQSIIPAAFRVVADPPPRITAISPEQAEKGAVVVVQIDGNDFKDPAPAAMPRVARVVFLSQDIAAGAPCAAPDCYECTGYTFSSPMQVTCSPPLGAMDSGAFIVRYEHLDDASFSDFAAFSVTNPSGNLDSVTASMPALNEPRTAMGAVVGRDDVGNRFIYAIGGNCGSGAATALDTVEVAAVTRFGDLSSFAVLPVRLPRKLSGLSAVRHGDYVFIAGGEDDGGTRRNEVYRARILGDDTAPIIAAPAVVAGGALAAGTYSYRVSAVMGMGTDNDGGESLPSDAESVRLTQDGSVNVSWQAVAGASSYRVFRSPQANSLSGSEVLIAAGVMGTSYTDDGSAMAGAETPQPPGATGAWMAMPSLGTERVDAGATIAEDPSGAAFLYVTGGITDATAPDPAATYELAPLTGSGGVTAAGTFAPGSNNLLGARSEHVVGTLNPDTAQRTSGLNKHHVVALQGGTSALVYTDIIIAEVTMGGQLGPWSQADQNNAMDRFGSGGVFANNFIFSIGGQSASLGFEPKGRTAEVCRTGMCADPPAVEWMGGDSGITLSVARYRPGTVYEAGLFYFLGGKSGPMTVLDSVERGRYQP